jgi:hypothetical protein
MLSETGTESRKLIDTKVIYNFETFPKSINTPSYDQRFRSYDHCKLGGVRSGQIKLSGQIWTLRPLEKELWKNSEYQNPIEFYNLSNEG